MRIPRQLVVGLVTLGVLALTAAGASAVTVPAFVASYGGSETPAGFMVPAGVAVAQASGDIYVTDSENGVLDVFDAAGLYQSSLQLTGFSNVKGVAVDQATNDVYIANSGELAIDVFGPAGESLLQINGSETPGGLMLPFGVAVNQKTGDVYVADPAFRVVDVFGASGQYKPSLQLTGTPPSAPVSGSFGFLTNVAVNQRTGDVYVADHSNGVVDVFNSSGEYLSQINGSHTPAGSMAPWSLAIDPSNGELYVGDTEHGVVDAFSEAGEYEGQIQGSETPAGSIEPIGLAIDQAHNVYIADERNRVIDIFNPGFARLTAGAVTNLQGTEATLNGTVTPGEPEVTACEVEYGTSTSYEHVAPCAQATPLTGSSPTAVTAHLTGLAPHTIYHYRFIATNKNGTNRTLAQTFKTPIIPATVTDQPAFASNVSQLSATLNGTIDPENIPTSDHFVYGTSTTYGSVAPTPDGSLPVNVADNAVSQPLAGLQPGTTYHFALVANNPAGQTVGPDETFTTPPVPPPGVSTGGASEVSVGAATLAGSVNPMGWETSYLFEYGPSTAYGSKWPDVGVALGSLNGFQPIVSYVQNLQPGTLYHYRLVASNPGGTSYGADQTFATPEYPASVIQEAPVLKAPLGINPETKTGSKAPKHKAKKRKTKRKASRRRKKR